ncbi:J domain-containing protein [Microvirga sp. STR05]|uniref:J domain-containing protein n=2 Tax=Hymenobacter TaxID=89966 RepID=A0A7G7WA00_9BACT|nr:MULTISPECIES: J domain-containing protein [Hymenobacter]MBD2714739.1 J domain-containing protein [Hymenobacter duratus]MBR7949644.1 J domain-containing protein [Microvirga sp. STR05]QNH63193.1 J domain-containing protein [Hymenobacter sediminicola]
MQNYYRLLGVPATASVAEIEAAYRALHARIHRRAARDPALNERLQEAYGSLQILTDPRRRWAYDQLLGQQPAPARQLSAMEALMERYAPVARWLNWALLAFCLLLALDRVLPLRELPGELVLSRQLVSISASASNPQVGYDIQTPLTKFRLHSAQAPRAREGEFLTVWRTPLLGVVRRVSSPRAPEGPAPFEPYGTGVYGGALAALPILLLLVAVVGVLPNRAPETRVNTAVAGSLLLVLTVVVMWLF